MSSNSPLRGNKYLLFIMVWQIVISLAIQLIEHVTGYQLFTSQLSIIPLHIIVFILPFALYLKVTSQNIASVLPLRNPGLANAGLIILMCVTLQPLMMVLSGLTAMLFPNNVSTAMGSMYSMPLYITLLATSLTPAITEEITLRGILLTNYNSVGIRKAAIINGLIFGMLHFDPQQFLYAALIGFLFACFVYYTKSIFASILAHFTFNFLQTVLAYASLKTIEQAGAVVELEQAGNSDILSAVVALSVIALIFTPVFIVIYRAFVSFNRRRLVENIVSVIVDDDSEFDPPETQYDIKPFVKTINKTFHVVNWPFAAMIAVYLLYFILMFL